MPYDKPLGRTREVIRIVRAALSARRWSTTGGLPPPAAGGQGHRPRQAAEAARHPERDTIPIWIAALGQKNVEVPPSSPTAGSRTSSSPRRPARCGADALAPARPSATGELGPLQISAGGMVAIGEDVKAMLDFARPMFALYIGGMGARGKNFYNDLARALRLREGGQGDPGPLPRRQEEGGRRAGAAGVDRVGNLVGPASYVQERIAAFRSPASPTSRRPRAPRTRRRSSPAQGMDQLSFDLQAHRGGAGLSPENTLLAFSTALTWA